MSAVLLPFEGDGQIDWPGFRRHVERTLTAGLTPAVNMDTGYVGLLDDSTRRRVLDETRGVLAGEAFVAGAFVADRPGGAIGVGGLSPGDRRNRKPGRHADRVSIVRPDVARRRARDRSLSGNCPRLRSLPGVRAGADVRAVRTHLRTGNLPRAAGDTSLRRGEAFVAEPAARMAAVWRCATSCVRIFKC